MRNLKRRLQEGEILHGCWLNLGSSVTAEIVGLAGFDWVLIDLEHGTGGERDVLHQLQAIEHTQAAAVVRVESSERQRIHRVLDLGAEGIMCPRVAGVADAQKLVDGLRYPPVGTRGVARMVRATGFGKHFGEVVNGLQHGLLAVVQVETLEMLEHLDAVAALEGVDVLFIGPADLSMALGIFGQFDHALFQDAVRATAEAARAHGKAAGILLPGPEHYEHYVDLGIRMIACGADGSFVVEGARSMAEKLTAGRNALRPERQGRDEGSR